MLSVIMYYKLIQGNVGYLYCKNYVVKFPENEFNPTVSPVSFGNEGAAVLSYRLLALRYQPLANLGNSSVAPCSPGAE